MLIPELKRLFMYDHWANLEVARSFASVAEPPRKSVAIYAHVAAAEQLWLVRIQRNGLPVSVWPDLTIEESKRQLGELHLRWRRYLDSATEQGLATIVNYANTQGEPFANSVRDILTHVVMHSSYHRAQIALNMRESGHIPPNTDFIHAVRSGLVE